jgi:hypothetical protein
VGCGPCSDEIPYLSHSKKAAVVAEADTGGRFDLVLVCPRPVARRVAPFGGWRRKWRLANAGVAEGSSGAVAALVLGGRRRPAVYRGGRIDGVGGGAGAVEALRDVVLVVDGRNHGGGAGRVCKAVARGQAVEGIGRARRGTHNLAQGEADVGARRLRGRAQRVVLEAGRRRRVQLDASPQRRAHHPGVVGGKRHRFLQESRRGDARQLSDISRRHGNCLPVGVTRNAVDVGIRGSRQARRKSSPAVKLSTEQTWGYSEQLRNGGGGGAGEGEGWVTRQLGLSL